MTIPERFFATIDLYLPWIAMIGIIVASIMWVIMLVSLVVDLLSEWRR
jgi:hypothetical protein